MEYLENIHSWVLYTNSTLELATIQKDINNLFSEYSFYPEIDWGKYGYRPPEGYQLLGAWRHPKSKSFAFLLDNPFMYSSKPLNQAILYISGEVNELKIIETRFESLKTKYEVEEKKDAIGLKVEERLESFKLSRSFKIFSIVLGIFTAIINAFSLYLRELPPPIIINNNTLVQAYSYFILIVHFSALTLLFFVIIVTILILLKYGLLILRKI